MAGLSGYQDGTYTRKQERQILGVLLGGKTSARPLGARSGITSIPTLAATSTVWTVGSFTAVLDVETDATMGPSLCVFDGNSTGSVTAASGSFIRYDLLYATILDPSTPPSVQYTAGVTGTTLPATPANSIPIAQITVPISGGGSPTITLIAPVAVAAGGVMPVSSAQPYPTSPATGQYVDDALYGLQRWNGSGYGPLTLAWQARQSTATTSLANNAYTTIPMDTFDVNTTGVAIGGGSFRAPTAGTYRVSGTINITGNVTGIRGGQFALNGTAIDGSFVEIPNNGASACRIAMPTILVTCAVSDVISMLGFQNSGGVLATANTPGSRLTVERI